MRYGVYTRDLEEVGTYVTLKEAQVALIQEGDPETHIFDFESNDTWTTNDAGETWTVTQLTRRGEKQ